MADTANGSSSVGFDSTTATTGATTTTAEAWTGLSAHSSELPSPHSLKWMKFDDEFVNALPSAGLYNSVVTGMDTCTMHILYVGTHTTVYSVLILLCTTYIHYTCTIHTLYIHYKYIHTLYIHYTYTNPLYTCTTVCRVGLPALLQTQATV